MAKEQDPVADRIAELEAEVAMLREENSGLLNAPSGQPQRADQVSTLRACVDGPQYRFQVEGRADRKNVPPVAPVTIEAPDESEAIRLACLVEEKDGQLVARPAPLNPSAYHFKAVCLDATARKAGIVAQHDEADTPNKFRPTFARRSKGEEEKYQEEIAKKKAEREKAATSAA